MYYNSLSPGTRGRLWRVFLVKAGLGEDQLDAVDPQIMDKLIRLNVNGREIKNIVKTASTFASHRNRCICMEDVNRVVEMDKFAAQQPGISSVPLNSLRGLTSVKRFPWRPNPVMNVSTAKLLVGRRTWLRFIRRLLTEDMCIDLWFWSRSSLAALCAVSLFFSAAAFVHRSR